MDLKEYNKIINDGWQLLKSYYPPKKGQEYWDNLIFDANNMVELNGRKEFAIKIAVVVVNELERVQKEEFA